MAAFVSLYCQASKIFFSTCKCRSICSTILLRFFYASRVYNMFSRSSSESEYSAVNSFYSLALRFLRSFSFTRFVRCLSILRVSIQLSFGFSGSFSSCWDCWPYSSLLDSFTLWSFRSVIDPAATATI